MNTATPPNHHCLLAPLALIPACQTSNGDADWFPAVDILEDAEEYLFRIDLPDMDPVGVRVAVDRGDLLVSGQRPEPSADAKRCLRIERPHGHFERRFALPDDASRHETACAFDKGVLELHVRKVSPGGGQARAPNAPPRLKLRTAS